MSTWFAERRCSFVLISRLDTGRDCERELDKIKGKSTFD